jgi:hypothetical protein
MKRARTKTLERPAVQMLAQLANGGAQTAELSQEAKMLVASDLAAHTDNGIEITDAGRAFLLRHAARRSSGAAPFRAQHGDIQMRAVTDRGVTSSVLADDAESPLAWLARRKGRDGRPLIEPHQLLAGERLRSDFTRAQMMPRTTSNWESPVARRQRSNGSQLAFTDATLAARQRMQKALGAVGREFSGLLLDVCCFLKRLEDVERERLWPARSAKVVLQLALDRLARHYGFAAQARGKERAAMTAWAAEEDRQSQPG